MLKKILGGSVLGIFLLFNVAIAAETTTPVNEAPFDFAQTVVGNDPIEPVNRFLGGAENIFLRWIFRPIGYVYGSIMPRPVIECFNTFTDNVAFPGPMLSSFIQGKFADGGIVFSRFMVNTVMTAGFFDPAEYWFNMSPVNEDFGQAFAYWGVGRGFYISIPAMSGNNARDTVGMVFDFALDPKTYIYGGQYFTFLNSTMSDYHAYNQALMGNWDAYVLFRDLGSMSRDIRVRDWDKKAVLARDEIKLKGKLDKYAVLPERRLDQQIVKRLEPMPEYHSQGAATDTLRALMFQVQANNTGLWPRLSFWNNTDLIHLTNENSVEVIPERPALNYRYLPVKGEKEAPLVVLVPGLGGSYIGSMSDALSEVLLRNGYSVVVMSTPFSWEFIEAAGTTNGPGFPPHDAADLRIAVKKIFEDLQQRYDIKPVSKTLAGYSMGALCVLFASEQEEKTNTLDIDRFLAINPPVDLLSGMSKLDEYYDTWQKWGKEEAYERGLMAAAKHPGIWQEKFQWQGYSPLAAISNKYLLAIDNDAAKLLIGYSFKRTLSEVIAVLRKRDGIVFGNIEYGWFNRQELYNALNALNFKNYAQNIILPGLNEKLKTNYTLEQLSELAALRSIENSLKNNQKVRIIHSTDDFLLTDEQRQWLAQIFDSRVVFLEHGAHLGNMYTKVMHDYTLKALGPRTKMPYIDEPAENGFAQINFALEQLPASK